MREKGESLHTSNLEHNAEVPKVLSDGWCEAGRGGGRQYQVDNILVHGIWFKQQLLLQGEKERDETAQEIITHTRPNDHRVTLWVVNSYRYHISMKKAGLDVAQCHPLHRMHRTHISGLIS